MVEVQTTRQNIEVLGDEGTSAGITRVDVQTAHGIDGTDEVQVSRQVIEVLGAEPSTLGVTRVDVQSAHGFDGTDEVQVSRMSIEVLASPDVEGSVTRVDVQSAHGFDGTDEVQVSRQVLEVLARQGSAGSVVPLALMDDAHIFLHNWATRAEMSNSFLNSVTYSPENGAESRRGLSSKTLRTLRLTWTVCDGTTGADLERLAVLLRRMTDARFQMPIYMDQIELDAAYLSSDLTINFDTSEGRFFQGARVAIVQLDACGQVTSSTFHIIDSMTNASLTFDATLGVAVPQGSLVFPIMDCEVVLGMEPQYETARVPTLELEVSEVPGASQLPPLKSDFPTGAPTFGEWPVFTEEPDWSVGVSKGRSRHGSTTSKGRGTFVNVESDRSRQTHKFTVTGKRSSMWSVLEFFETRRGRLRAFWLIDQDQYMDAVDIDASGNFVGVAELGTLADFQEEYDHVGIVMADGTVFVRDVSIIQQILTVFRISMGSAVTTGLDINDVIRVARARLSRFITDEIIEVWTHTGFCGIEVSFIEVLNEGDYPV